MEAELADEVKGPRVVEVKGASQKKALGGFGADQMVRLGRLNLTGMGSATIRGSLVGGAGKVELRAGGVSGALIGEGELKGTGGADRWAEVEIPVTIPAEARGDVVVIFRGLGLMNFDWIQFNPKRVESVKEQ